ncbi:MAG: sulfopyruvate decarboxylase subunit alpha [bacterium]|nr:sulfopyruvate decarboxylase subunit alpha [bacterium]
MSLRFASLQHHGVDFVAAVPCSYLQKFLAACESLPPGTFIPAVREDHAVSACAGAWLAGKQPLAVMQNSGLGYCLEVLASLHILYDMPLPMVVSDRGAETDFPEHQGLGSRTRGLLDLFDIPWRTAGENLDADSDWLLGKAAKMSRPAVLLVDKEFDR